MTPTQRADWHPHFVIIGAAKAATTWIQIQLQANPAIYMPDPEPHFFTREYELGEEHYRHWFAPAPPDASLLGEKSADYLADHDVPARLHRMLPDARLVLQLRNPVERAYSDYKMLFRRGTVKGQPEEYLSSLDNPFPRFLDHSLYGEHIARWLEYFPREQLHVFRFEDVARTPRAVIERVCQHIGAPVHFDPELAGKKENNSREHILPLPVRAVFAPLKNSVKPLRGKRWFESARALFAREIAYPPLRPALRHKLEEFYASDIALTEQLTGLDLSDWKRADHRSAA